MLNGSLGAGNFSIFWQYCDPTLGYYLEKYILKPLKFIFPSALSLEITFGVVDLYITKQSCYYNGNLPYSSLHGFIYVSQCDFR
jgi:hypothetical protein